MVMIDIFITTTVVGKDITGPRHNIVAVLVRFAVSNWIPVKGSGVVVGLKRGG